MLKLTIGCDPEFFLFDSKIGHHVSAHDLLPGTKEEPFKVKQGAVQVDGVACEFNTDPASTEDEFVDNVKTVLAELRKLVPERYTFDFRPSVVFDPVYFKKLPFTAVQLGCTPDFNGYTFQANPPPDGERTTLRTASGHVHIGWQRNTDEVDHDHSMVCGRIARNLDYFLGLPSLEWDNDKKRRQLYGKAGCYRPKPYGLEYRTLSNKWLTSENLMRRVYSGAVAGVSDYFENGVNCKFMKHGPEEAARRLNHG